MSECVFCSIVKGIIPAQKLYEDDIMVIFKDIEPKAKLHFLAIPKKHYRTLADAEPADRDNLGYMLNKISQLQSKLEIENGYRLIINQGADAGQTVFHLHIHILGGQALEFTDLRNKS